MTLNYEQLQIEKGSKSFITNMIDLLPFIFNN